MKKNKCEKVFSTLMAIVLVLNLLPIVAFASGSSVTSAQELVDAFAAAESGDTITLGADFSYSYEDYGTIEVDKAITLDFNGYKITTGAGMFSVADTGDFTLKAAQIDTLGPVLIDEDNWEWVCAVINGVYGTLTIESTAGNGIDDRTSDYDEGCNFIENNYGQITIKEGTFSPCYSLVYGCYDDSIIVIENASVDGSDTLFCDICDQSSVTIKDGTYRSRSGIVSSSGGNVVVENGTFISKWESFWVCDGALTIKDGKFVAGYSNDDEFPPCIYIDGTAVANIEGGNFYSTGAALVSSWEAVANLSGGVLQSKNNSAIEIRDSAQVNIAEGFNASPSNWDEIGASTVIIRPDTITVTFMSEGEEYDTWTGSASNISLPQNPVHSGGYTFLYWGDNNGAKADLSQVYRDTTLYAVFSDKTYTVTFYDKGDTTTKTVSALTPLKNIDGFDRVEYVDGFLAWLLESTGEVVDGDTDLLVTSDLTLTAYYIESAEQIVHNEDELRTAIDYGFDNIYVANSFPITDTIIFPYTHTTIVGMNPNDNTITRADSCTESMFSSDEERSFVEFKNLKIDGNNVEADSAAITFTSEFGWLQIDNCSIENCINTYTNEDGSYYWRFYYGGGAIRVENDVEGVRINNSKLCNNRSANSGGAIYFGYDVNNVSIEDCEICHNSAQDMGGGIYFHNTIQWIYDDRDCSFTNIDLHDNTARCGGGAFLQGVPLKTSGFRVYDNQAEHGGGIAIDCTGAPNAVMNFSGTDFYRNFASGATEKFYAYFTYEHIWTAEDSFGDDVYIVEIPVSQNFMNITLPDSMNARKYSELTTSEDRKVCGVQPFKDSQGNDEAIPADLNVPFEAWYLDGEITQDYWSSSEDFTIEERFESRDTGKKICEDEDKNRYLEYNYETYYSTDGLFMNGLKAIYTGYLVKYVANNGTDEQRYDMEAYPENTSVTVKSNETDIGFTRNGYRFIGWNSRADGNGGTFQDNFVITKNTVLYAQWEPLFGQLTISKTGSADIDLNQTFLFRVTGNGVDFTVTVHGNDSVMIQNLPFGDYDVTELTDWSWRYTPDAVSKTVSVSADGASVAFTNDRTDNKMLDNGAYCVNLFSTHTVKYVVKGDPKYGSPEDANTPADITGINEGDSVTLAAPLTTSWQTYDGNTRTRENYTVHYLKKGSNESLAPSRTYSSQPVGNTILNKAPDFDGYVVDGPLTQTLTIQAVTGTWTFTGWCSDEACTIPVSNLDNITADTTVYGKWVYSENTTNNIIFYYEEGEYISYTVRYVDKSGDSYSTLSQSKVVDHVVLGSTVTETPPETITTSWNDNDWILDTSFPGSSPSPYTFTPYDGQVITFYYKYYSSYTVNYLDMTTGEPIAPPKEVENVEVYIDITETAPDTITNEDGTWKLATRSDYRYATESPYTFRVGPDWNKYIYFYYKKQ